MARRGSSSPSSGCSRETGFCCTRTRSRRRITFLSGSGEATLGEETVPIGAGVSLYIPAGVVHGFHCTEGTLHVLVVFPVPEFAETTIVEPEGSEAG